MIFCQPAAVSLATSEAAVACAPDGRFVILNRPPVPPAVLLAGQPRAFRFGSSELAEDADPRRQMAGDDEVDGGRRRRRIAHAPGRTVYRIGAPEAGC
jgi:hypothetical protein